MTKPNLAIAMGVRRHAAKKMGCGGAVGMSEGGEVPESSQMGVFDHKDLAKAVINKMSGKEAPADDFLSSDADTEMHTEAMPDDTDERMHEMSDAAEPKGILHGIMSKIHMKHKGR